MPTVFENDNYEYVICPELEVTLEDMQDDGPRPDAGRHEIRISFMMYFPESHSDVMGHDDLLRVQP